MWTVVHTRAGGEQRGVAAGRKCRLGARHVVRTELETARLGVRLGLDRRSLEAWFTRYGNERASIFYHASAIDLHRGRAEISSSRTNEVGEVSGTSKVVSAEHNVPIAFMGPAYHLHQTFIYRQQLCGVPATTPYR